MSGEREPHDKRQQVPSLPIMMGLVSEVRQGLKNFNKVDKRQLLFHEELEKLKYRCNYFLTDINLSTHWEKFSNQMASYVEDRVGGSGAAQHEGSTGESMQDILAEMRLKIDDLMKVKAEVEKISLSLEPLITNGNILNRILDTAQKQGQVDQ